MDERNASINELIIKYQGDLIKEFFPIIEVNGGMYAESKYIGDSLNKIKRIDRFTIYEHEEINFASTDYSEVNAIAANSIKIRINNAVVNRLLQYAITEPRKIYLNNKIKDVIIHLKIDSLKNFNLNTVITELYQRSNLNTVDNIHSVKPVIVAGPHFCKILHVNGSLYRDSPYLASIHMSLDHRIENMIFVVFRYNDLDVIDGPKLTSLGNVLLGDNVFIGNQIIPKFTIKNNVPVMACITIKQDIK